MLAIVLPCFFTITDTSTSPFSPLSLHDALPIFQPQLVDGEYGLLEYDLDPGSYTVQASRSGYETAQSTFSLSEEDLDGEGTIRPVTLVLEESVQSGGNDDGQTGGDAGTDTRGLEMLVDPNI